MSGSLGKKIPRQYTKAYRAYDAEREPFQKRTSRKIVFLFSGLYLEKTDFSTIIGVLFYIHNFETKYPRSATKKHHGTIFYFRKS